MGHRLGWVALVVLMLGVVVLATFARFHDLGGAPLAEDEYYTTRSIEWVIATGLPEIPSGGYYTRGLLFQYLAAGFAQVFGADAFAYRLPAAIFGLLVSMAAFFYARRFAGIAIGAVVAIALLLSSWEIEFSRFVRFYTLFQVFLLFFLLALDKAYFEVRDGWRYAPHAILLLCALAHELAILFAPLLFLPLLPNWTRLRLDTIRAWLGFAVVSLTVAIVVALITVGLDTSDYGVVDRFPADYDGTVRDAGLFALPSLPFFRLSASPFLHIVIIGLIVAGLVVAFLGWQKWADRQPAWADLLLVLALLAAVFHLFAVVGLLLLFAFARYDLWRLTAQPHYRLAILGITLVVMAGWLALALVAPERLLTGAVVDRWQMELNQPGALGAMLRALWSTFFGFPDFYATTLRPFASELPELGLAVVAALIWFTIAHRHDAIPDLLRHPGALVIYWALTMALFSAGDSTTRYWFPLLPIIYTLLAVSLAEAFVRWQPRAEAIARQGACAAFLVLFMLGPDFNPRHVVDVGADAVRYRTGSFSRFEQTWYPRPDIRTAAATVEAWHAELVEARPETPETRIVIENLPAFPYYMESEPALYYARGWGRFASYSREQGSRERWTDLRLLGTPAELADYARPAGEILLVRTVDPATRRPPGNDLVAALRDDGFVEEDRVVAGADERLEIIRLRYRESAAGAAAP